MSAKAGSKDALLLMQQRFPQYFPKGKEGEPKTVERRSSTGSVGTRANVETIETSASMPSPPTSSAPHDKKDHTHAVASSSPALPSTSHRPPSLFSPHPPTSPPLCPSSSLAQTRNHVVAIVSPDQPEPSELSTTAPANASTESEGSLPALREGPRLSVDETPNADSPPLPLPEMPPTPSPPSVAPSPFFRSAPSPFSSDAARTATPPPSDDDVDDDAPPEKPTPVRSGSGGGGRPMPMTPSTTALLQSLRRKTPFNLGASKDLMMALQSRGKKNDSSDSSSSDDEVPTSTVEPYVASVGAMKVKHRHRGSAVTFHDQFPNRHDSTDAKTPIMSEAPSNFTVRQTSPVFLPRVRLSKPRIFRF